MITLFIVLLICIYLLFTKALKSSLELRFILLVTSGYWFLNFILNPALMLLSNSTGLATIVSDNRISGNLFLARNALQAAAIGCLIFLASVAILTKIPRREKSLTPVNFSGNPTYLLVILAIIGGISLYIEQTSFANIFSKSLVSLASINFSVFLWIRKDLVIPIKVEFFLTVVGLGELFFLYSKTNYSKGVVLTPILIFIYRLEIWSLRHNRISRLIFLVTLMLSFFYLFNLLQAFKLGETFSTSEAVGTSQFPAFLLVLLPIAQRFDQFPRIIDAQFSTDPNFQGFSRWLHEIWKNLSWNPGSGRVDSTFGQVWNTQITSQSIPNAKFSNVSLAQGFVSDGILWHGYVSLTIEAFFIAVVYIYLSRLLSGNLKRIYLVFCLISNGALFESGSVALAALFSNTLKIYLTLVTFEYLISIKTRKN